MLRKIGIIGLGLIGGSLGLALKKTSRYEVLGVDKNKFVVEKALKMKAVDAAFLKDIKALANVEVVILAVPVNTIVKLAKFFLRFPKQVIITDVGSVKRSIVDVYECCGIENFVGAHPIAGIEHSGIDYAKEDLFKDKYCIITKTKNTKKVNIELIKNIWESVGAKVFVTTPQKHDELIAYSSHLVHILAYCMANTINGSLAKKRSQEFQRFIGPSFSGFMRIVSSSARLWEEILLSNKENLLSSLRDYKEQINIFEKLLQEEDSLKLRKYLREAKNYIYNILK